MSEDANVGQAVVGGGGRKHHEWFEVEGVSARGRNGWFRPRTLDGLVRSPVDDDPATVRCSVMSARPGDTEPIVLELAGAEMLAFGEMCVRLAREAIALDAGREGEGR